MFSSMVVLRVCCVSLMPWLLIEGHFEHIYFFKDAKCKMEMDP